MGFNDIDNYGDRDAGDIIMEKVCEGVCHLPGCARNNGKFTGNLFELRLNLNGFGAYTAGGYDLDRFRNELGCDCITGLLCNASYDPYGCEVNPVGCEFKLAEPASSELGNIFGDEEGCVDFSTVRLQVWKDGAEVNDGWQADPNTDVWVIVWAM